MLYSINHLAASVLLILSVTMTSCSGVSTDDAEKAYRYWAHEKPMHGVRVLYGQYWRSGHFTLEYILFLKLQVPKGWMTSYVQQNKLVMADPVVVSVPNAPDWFAPKKNSVYYQGNQGSFYCYDSSQNLVWIYETLL